LTPRASPLVRAIRQRCTDESYSSRGRAGRGGRGRGVIVMRGTYLYRKCVLFHRPRQRVQRTDRPVSRPSARLFIFFTFGIARGRGGSTRGAVSRSITKRNFRPRLLERFFVRLRGEGGRTRRALNAFSTRHQSLAAGAREHKGKESLVSVVQNGFRVINAAKRTRRNHERMLERRSVVIY